MYGFNGFRFSVYGLRVTVCCLPCGTLRFRYWQDEMSCMLTYIHIYIRRPEESRKTMLISKINIQSHFYQTSIPYLPQVSIPPTASQCLPPTPKKQQGTTCSFRIKQEGKEGEERRPNPSHLVSVCSRFSHFPPSPVAHGNSIASAPRQKTGYGASSAAKW